MKGMRRWEVSGNDPGMGVVQGKAPRGEAGVEVTAVDADGALFELAVASLES